MKHQREHKRRRRTVTAAIRRSEATLYSQLIDVQPEKKKQNKPRKKKHTTWLGTQKVEQSSNLKERSSSLDFSRVDNQLLSPANRRTTVSSSTTSTPTHANERSTAKQPAAKSVKEHSGIESTCNLFSEPSNGVLHELRLINAQLGYLCLKRLQTASKSCHFLTSTCLPLMHQENIINSETKDQAISMGQDSGAQVGLLETVERQSVIDIPVLPEGHKPNHKPQNAKGNNVGNKDGYQKQNRETWADVAEVLNHVWGVVYLIASIAVFWMFLLPLLKVAISAPDQKETRFKENRLGCSGSVL